MNDILLAIVKFTNDCKIETYDINIDNQNATLIINSKKFMNLLTKSSGLMSKAKFEFILKKIYINNRFVYIDLKRRKTTIDFNNVLFKARTKTQISEEELEYIKEIKNERDLIIYLKQVYDRAS